MRLENTLRNMMWKMISQLLLILAGLLVRKVLLDSIGTEKVGLNYLLNDIVNLIAIADLGLTGIVAYHLYEPLEKKNTFQIIKIIGFYRKANCIIFDT